MLVRQGLEGGRVPSGSQRTMEIVLESSGRSLSGRFHWSTLTGTGPTEDTQTRLPLPCLDREGVGHPFSYHKESTPGRCGRAGGPR